MPVARWHVKPHRAGSMVDIIDTTLHEMPDMMREMRNIQYRAGGWDRRWGWAKANATAMPWTQALGATAFRDTQDTLHILVIGDDGNLHASVDGGATFQIVTLHTDVDWDETYQVTFARAGDDLFICIGAVNGDSQNLRYNGITAAAYGVSLTAPVLAPTVADGGVGGNIHDGQFDYFVVFYDATTGRESDRTAIGTVTLARPDGPEAPPLLAEGVAGNVVADVPHRYRYSFYDPATGIESELCSNFRSISPTVNSQIELTDVRCCPDAGVWQRRIYRDDDGAGYMLLATIADNTTTVYSDNIAVPAGAEYEYPTRQIELTAIPTFGGTGRVIYRRIYRQDDGNGYSLLGTIIDNVTVAYTDQAATPLGAAWVQRLRVPVCKAVAFNKDGSALFMNDVENDEPARIYVMATDDPEALSADTALAIQSAGTGDDPIVGGVAVRDGVMVFKRRSIYWMPRQCKKCESVIEGVGAVSRATIRNVGTMVAFLSDLGPCVVSHMLEEDWRFVGPDPRRFCLAEFWETVLEDRLPWATCTHYRQWGIIEWHVQRCRHDAAYVSQWGDHNDTSIVWDYTANRVWIGDRMIDCGFELPSAGLTGAVPWGAFPLGYAGPLYDGAHGDGVDELIRVQVVSSDGVYITIGATNLLTGKALDLDAEGWRGSIFFVTSGPGAHVCQAVIDPCWRTAQLIVDHSLASGVVGQRIRTAEALAVDATSKAWIGGSVKREWIDGVDAGDPDTIKTMPHCDIQIKAL